MGTHGVRVIGNRLGGAEVTYRGETVILSNEEFRKLTKVKWTICWDELKKERERDRAWQLFLDAQKNTSGA